MPDAVKLWNIEISISQIVITVDSILLNRSRIFLGSNLCLSLNINIAICLMKTLII